jgi:hypothetical protein
VGDDVVDASGVAEEADAGVGGGDGSGDGGGRRSAATEFTVFSAAETEVMTEVVAAGSSTAAENSAGFAAGVDG